jgi:drug/metabolite transporter (DMT)-like permease
LNRQAVGVVGMDPASFAFIRVVAGATVLMALVALRNPRLAFRLRPSGMEGMASVIGLSVYLAGFSFAYLALDAGMGALILFGTVQITMFAGAVWRGQSLGSQRLIGAIIAFAGLLVLLWPGSVTFPPVAALAMVAAGVGWGAFSLGGIGVTDALGRTAQAFLLSVPLMALVWWAVGSAPLIVPGLWLAIVSGAVTSGLGYALWYAILPKLQAQRAAVAQLTVPVIAAVSGAVWLNEFVDLRFIFASLLVLAGVALASLTPQSKG